MSILGRIFRRSRTAPAPTPDQLRREAWEREQARQEALARSMRAQYAPPELSKDEQVALMSFEARRLSARRYG